MFAVEEQSRITNEIRNQIDRTAPTPKCRFCNKTDEKVFHILSGCETLANTANKKRYNDVGKITNRYILQDNRTVSKLKMVQSKNADCNRKCERDMRFFHLN